MTDTFSIVLHRFLSHTQSSKKGKGKVQHNFLSALSGGTDKASWDVSLQKFSQSVNEDSCPLQEKIGSANIAFDHNIKFNIPKAPFHEKKKQLSTKNETSEKKHTTPAVYDRDWLYINASQYATENPQFLCADIFTTLRSGQEDIETHLVDSLGYTALDFIQELLANRETIVHNILRMSDYDEQQQTNKPVHVESKRPIYGTQLTIQSEKEMKQEKRLRKEQKKANKNKEEDAFSVSMGILGFDGRDLKQAREEALTTASQAPLFSSNNKSASTPQYPHVYQSGSSGTTLSLFGTRFALPVGTERVEYNDYEETTIPVPKQAPVRTGERRVQIAEMDSLARNAFKAYDTLNRVQSIVYPIAYKTDENMLVCAPTGAGKTDVAMLTVLRCLTKYCSPPPRMGTSDVDFEIAKNEFKIVYVAPMKALAAEIVDKMQKRLKFLGVKVRELTGDMQLTKAEIHETQFIVTTPEKWDVITRKGTGDVELTQKVKLLIIDEVHLLNEDRGAVIETIIARTLRQVESSQSLIRIVGLSATLPNYVDVASFLRVNPYQGLFYFDGGFRPVPLEQHFLGIKGKPNTNASNEKMNKACFEKVADLVKEGHQVMVFVHARKDTVNTAQMLREEVATEGIGEYFDCIDAPNYSTFKKDIVRSRNKEMKDLFSFGFGIHHAGMLRSDRTMTERMFADGSIKVLCCTATLAWGVNLPAYAVVIKGTQVYDSNKGSYVDLSILDVLQIFGRAGRPQYETHGVGYILTTHDKLSHYISAITQQHPIESKFIENIVDNLNAEISLGTVTNTSEAVAWLSYTYLFVRMKKNPMVYGMQHSEPVEDPLLGRKRYEIISLAARKLADSQMILYDETEGYLIPRDLGRIASNFYISHKSIETFNSLMKKRMTEADVLAMMSRSSEFEQIKSRETEHKELKKLFESTCACDIKGGPEDSQGKVNILLQSYISNAYIDDFALVSDSAYVVQNAGRIARALFEIALNRQWGSTASVLLDITKAVDKRMWTFQHPLRQTNLSKEVIMKLENRGDEASIEEMREMQPQDLADLVQSNPQTGMAISKAVDQFPLLSVEARMAPLTRNILSIELTLTPDFVWSDRIHGAVEPWYVWIEDAETEEVYCSQYIAIYKKQLGEPVKVLFTVPLVEPIPSELYVRTVSDRWMGAETEVVLSLENLVLPTLEPSHRELLPLNPLPIKALKNEEYESILFRQQKTHFDPIETQLFHTVYHTDQDILLGAPIGANKATVTNLAAYAAFRDRPNSKIVYLSSKRGQSRERMQEWSRQWKNKKQADLSSPTQKIDIASADIIFCTPSTSNQWEESVADKVSLVIIDSIHLLEEDFGIEMTVSRIKHLTIQNKVRILALSVPLANAVDMAEWLGIDKNTGLFNFPPTAYPLEVHINGFPGKFYGPRMAMMNKPTYAAIKAHSHNQPAIVFTPSRRQIKQTALELIAYCGLENDPRQWLNMSDVDFDMLHVDDELLQMTLSFGIGVYHLGLGRNDAKTVKELYMNSKIQVLLVTSDLAWQLDSRISAHLVVIKGTEYYKSDGDQFVDFPMANLLQMMSKAGGLSEDIGVVRIFAQENRKNFYQTFLRDPLPIESSLHKHLDLRTEILSGRIKNKQDAVDFLTWTFMYRRLTQNPNFYGLEGNMDKYLTKLVNQATESLVQDELIDIEDSFKLRPAKNKATTTDEAAGP
ncbi:Sec63 Brl domain-containing protein [Sporodiniella umbellata]|nr:Sec63 Brl domain-containing protein [Sporodiniella umbellata]